MLVIQNSFLFSYKFDYTHKMIQKSAKLCFVFLVVVQKIFWCVCGGGACTHACTCVHVCLYVCARTHVCQHVYTVTIYHKLSQNRQGQNTGCNVKSVFNVV